MARSTPAELAALRTVLPGGAAFNGVFWWLNRLGTAGNPTGVQASATRNGTATFGAVLEHDSQTRQGERCALEVIATNRTPDVGFTGSNFIEINGFRDLITCPLCGLSGSIIGNTWVSA